MVNLPSAPDSGPSLPVERVVETTLPTRHGRFRLVGFRGADGHEHVTLSLGIDDDRPHSYAPIVRLHSECLTGDALGSRRCDCGEQLDAALAAVAAAGEGVVVYIRGHEGRGIGLLQKLRAYRLQDGGMDTVDANLALGHLADQRTYDQAAGMLNDLGVGRIRLMSSNPTKQQALAELGIEVVDRLGMFVPERAENLRYLQTKRARMGHDAPTAVADAPRLPAPLADPALAQCYAELADAGPTLVIAQLAQSLDGFIATADGDGAALSGPEDHRHLHTLRSQVDAVVVGASTVTNDDPRLTVREVEGPNPVRVIVDPHARIPRDSTALTDGAPTLWLVADSAARTVSEESVTAEVVVPDGFTPAQIIATLRRRGLGRILVEGGGDTVSRFLTDDALDRLFVTTVPVLLGSGVRGVRGPAVAKIADVARHRTRRYCLGDDTCIEFELRA